MSKAILCPLLITLAIALNEELPKLIRTTHTGTILPAINVTIG